MNTNTDIRIIYWYNRWTDAKENLRSRRLTSIEFNLIIDQITNEVITTFGSTVPLMNYFKVKNLGNGFDQNIIQLYTRMNKLDEDLYYGRIDQLKRDTEMALIETEAIANWGTLQPLQNFIKSQKIKYGHTI